MTGSRSYVCAPRLRAGDRIAVCAPAGPVPTERLRAGVALLEQHFRVACEPDVFAKAGYLAGSDQRRADELNGYLRDPDIRAIMVARGGYGIMRILDQLDADALRRDPKLLVGFSDATALLCWAYTRASVRGIHGPVVTQLGELAPRDQQWLVQLMTSSDPPGRLPGDALVRTGDTRSIQCEGPLIGGNLCLLGNLLGTPYAAPLTGAVVLLEDVGERPYALDRYLTSMILADAFAGAAGALIGSLTECEETRGPPHPDAGEVIDERLRSIACPALAGAGIGHGETNLAVPFGGRCALDFATGALELLEPAVW